MVLSAFFFCSGTGFVEKMKVKVCDEYPVREKRVFYERKGMYMEKFLVLLQEIVEMKNFINDYQRFRKGYGAYKEFS